MFVTVGGNGQKGSGGVPVHSCCFCYSRCNGQKGSGVQ